MHWPWKQWNQHSGKNRRKLNACILEQWSQLETINSTCVNKEDLSLFCTSRLPFFSQTIQSWEVNNDNRVEWSPIWSVIMWVMKKIRWMQNGSQICWSQVWLQTELDNNKSCYQLMVTISIKKKIHLEQISLVETMSLVKNSSNL